jgi:hypothetical protein
LKGIVMSISASCYPPCGGNPAQPLPKPPPPLPAPTPSPSSQILTNSWAASVNTTIASPGNGAIRWNTAAQFDASIIAVATVTNTNTDVKLGLKSAIAGDILYIQRQNDSSIWMKYRVTAAPIDNGNWIQYAVATLGHSGGPFGGNQGLLVALN